MESLLYVCYDRLYRFILFKVRLVHDAEDILQETLIRISEHIERYNPQKGAFQSWMFQICRNQIADYYRTQKKEVSLDYHMDPIWDRLELPEKTLELKEMMEALLKRLEDLPHHEKEILELRYFAGLSNKEISQSLELEERTVSSSLSKARNKLRNLISIEGVLL